MLLSKFVYSLEDQWHLKGRQEGTMKLEPLTCLSIGEKETIKRASIEGYSETTRGLNRCYMLRLRLRLRLELVA
jgi:hypothetical protein